ncbi:MAG: GntR family transcriptional regulator [Bacilli bacterium]|nr:GntR family transcriptional regulator [Bacilli bacterium]
MHIIISNSSNKPIYEQIKDNIKEMILSGELSGEETLPSIRMLAKDLRVSVITTKRAYEELEKESFVTVIPGKGYFVKNKSEVLRREEVLKKIEELLEKAITTAQTYHIDKEELLQMADILYEGDSHGK